MMEMVISKAGKDLLVVPLEENPFRVGRAGTNDLAIPDQTISRNQFLLEKRGDKLILKDQSGNGTLVNGKRIQEGEVGEGACIELGFLTMTLRQQQEVGLSATTMGGGNTEQMPRAQEGNDEAPLSLIGNVDGHPLRVPLKGQVMNVGSDPGNHVALKDSYVSSFHCRLSARAGSWFVQDLDSTNGTMVNGVRVHEARLEPGNVLSFGRIHLTVEAQSPDGSAAGFYGMISVDPAMQPVFDLIRKAGPTDETVLITGESGSGKELVARALHRLSQRSNRPLIPLNCSALTKDLLESELFGHERGAFTGAQGRRTGLFEEADHGTVFLDEIGELPIDMQAKLLRVLENGEIRRVGSNVPIKVNVRVIAATHRDLPELVRQGQFREDLYYRICVIDVHIPPLRKRPMDVPLLAEAFLSQNTRTLGARHFTEEALTRLQAYRYPGNVRELKHIITRAAIFSNSDKIGIKSLKFSPPTLADRVSESQIYRKGKTLRDVEIETIQAALKAHGGNQSLAAKQLGLYRSTFLLKLRKYNLDSRGEIDKGSIVAEGEDLPEPDEAEQE